MTNPLLTRIKLPGRVFQLPSKGIFYKPGEVLDETVKDGEIQVHAMSAIAEIKLRSPDLLYSGIALKEICEECIPSIKRYDLLINKDVDAIFFFLNISTYGSDKTIETIHECNLEKYNKYNINLEATIANTNNDIIKDSKKIEDLSTLTLDNGQVIKLKPVTYISTVELSQLNQEILKDLREKLDKNESNVDIKNIEKYMIKDIISSINSVDNISDDIMISEWLRYLPRVYIDQIVDQIHKFNDWGIKRTFDLKCPDCGESFEYDAGLDPINFFLG